MSRGDKSACTNERHWAERVADGFEARGVPHDGAEMRGWATVNRREGGGKPSGFGRGKRAG